MPSSPPSPPEGGDVSDIAIDWLVRVRLGAADPEDFALWRAASPAHEAAAVEAEALLDEIGQTPTAQIFGAERAFGAERVVPLRPPPAPTLRHPRALSRRRLLTGAAAAGVVAAAGAGALVAAGPGVGGRVIAALDGGETTSRGERRAITLADGSRVTLAGCSAIRVDVSAAGRRIELLAGEALFQVAADTTRPFIVTAGTGRAEAMGTLFSVACAGRAARVVVVEGRVEAGPADGHVPMPLTAGQAATTGPDMTAEPVDAASLTAWARGRLIVTGQPLSEVAARLDRDGALRLLVLGDTARTLPVTGVFDLDDPEGTLRAIATVLPVRVRRVGGVVVVTAAA
ncbi:FecR family protein [Tistrella mobilis]|uniref:FecR family protein n=1 Tax=Tistrella mobilis TaxID=171437 RepID=UPI0002FD1FF9|nr:FecR domain-containing protein [Tistrella mobilis]